ncbi:MAG: dTDP-4-dehydrorhamnose reductase [Deltaproteobacteria bacterium]|nr:dTDP-4-dehydrorhamnose reductase [Deltaproteobacteria bacterium]
MKILIIGSRGQLGSDLVKALETHELITPEHYDLNVANKENVKNYIIENEPHAVINCSAFHDVPKCENDPITSFSVNTAGPFNIAETCKEIGAEFFHISTDYVFNGHKGFPYKESDTPDPLMVYGVSKYAGELLALKMWEKTAVIRTTGLFGKNPCRAKPGGRNFVDLMLHLGRQNGEVKVVGDQYCCPTYTPDLANQIAVMVTDKIEYGIYHAVTPPGCSWYDFAKTIFDLADLKVDVQKVNSDFFPANFKRPDDSRLSNERLAKSGMDIMRPLKEVTMEYLTNDKLNKVTVI